MTSILLCFYFIIALFARSSHSERLKTRNIIFAMFPFVMLTGFRGLYVGPDTQAYYLAYMQISQYSNLVTLLSNSRFEDGFALFMYVSSHLGLSYNSFQFLLAVVTYFLIGIFIKKYSSDMFLASYIMLANGQVFGTMNVVRMWLAVGIVLLSTKYILNKKPVKFFLIVILASLFHFSALIFLLMYPLSKAKVNFKTISIIILCSIVCGFAFVPLATFFTSMIGLYSNYLAPDRLDTSSNIAVKLSCLIQIIYFMFFVVTKAWKNTRLSDLVDEADNNNTNVQKLYNLSFLVSAVVLGLSIIGLRFNMMGRIVHYFNLFYLVIIPTALDNVKDRRSRFLIRLCIMVCLALVYFITLASRPEWYMVNDYHTFFN